MPSNQTFIHTFLTQSRAKERPRLLISLAPPPKHTSLGGRLFILAEYPPLTEAVRRLPALVNQMMRRYDEEAGEEAENAFERALEWANRFINQNWPAEPRAKINLLFGCLKNNRLQFATAGQISGYIIFPAPTGSPTAPEEKNYRHLDLIKTYGLKQEDGVFFTTLISGELAPDNFAVFCTASVFDFLTPDRLKKILLSRPTEEACRYLEKTLSQIESGLSFGGLIINLAPQLPRTIKNAPLTKITSDNSIRRLIRKEQETENILSPSLWAAIKNVLSGLKKPAAEQKDLETVKKIARIYNRLTGWEGRVKFFLRRLANGLARLGLSCFALLKHPTKPQATIQYLRELLAHLRNFWRRKFLSLPRSRRLLLVGLTALILVLLVSLSAGAVQKSRRLEQENYNQLLNGIKEKLDQAESSLIYKNEEQARLLLTTAEKELAGFPQNSPNRRLMKERLAAGLETLAAKLRHLETVAPVLAADFSSVNLPCQPTDLIKTKTGFLLFCRGDKNIFQYLEKSKILTALDSPLLGELKNKIVGKDGALWFLNGADRLTQFDPQTASFASQDIVWPKAETDIKSIGYYGGYLYGLDAKNNLIYKHSPSTTGFAKGALWLKEILKIDDAADWTIDGSVYLAKNNGEIWKLETGRRQNFDLSKLDPPLSAAGRIFSSPDSKNLFILDPGQKRVVIWNKKDQKLVSQFTSDQFDGLKNFSVNEKDKIIYILNNQKILNIKY